jgi:hypothetical protein
MIDTAENPRAVVGSNQPPNAFRRFRRSHWRPVRDSEGFLDGDGVNNEGDAEQVPVC